MYGLIDANAFYCSAEQVFNPAWRNKAIIVLSNNDGCVVAANRAALNAGIKKFVPYFQVRDLCQQHGVIALSSNYELYSDLSAKMMQVISRFAPEQFIYSIDESFVSFKRSFPAIPCLLTQGQQIRRTVWKECRLPVCVGIGPTLTLAKVANHAAKKIEGYQGVCVIDNDNERISILQKMAAADVWGIGRQTSKRLALMNIKSADQLAKMPAGLAKKQFSIEIERTVRELNGEECKQFDAARADKQQIYSTRSMGERITTLDQLRQALCKHTGIAATKARRQGSLCQVMTIFAASSPFDDQPVSLQSTLRFACPTQCSLEMTQAVFDAAPQVFKPGVRYYKIGVGLLDLVNEHQLQLDLFNPPSNNPALMKVFDGVNGRYGTDTLFLAAQGIHPKWGMRRQLLSPQYTTRWQDIPHIKC
ncbi:Y-family DNA polymerase [Shewanella sp. NIFS-20-20]|uniref:Y-family DNA polymerase n=1 Tax=Shewanella sp. NIFS-20-20 TaxID=2853806 RepID=UPI001C4418FA|nr:Y-family DNA polymerase [Shewanella sp. NIFS-20-20]MBV7315784.1 Y-family DNA polymerase [Shewanella sp. NIFS-20-20]